jgi:hypothetical protein
VHQTQAHVVSSSSNPFDDDLFSATTPSNAPSAPVAVASHQDVSLSLQSPIDFHHQQPGHFLDAGSTPNGDSAAPVSNHSHPQQRAVESSNPFDTVDLNSSASAPLFPSVQKPAMAHYAYALKVSFCNY